ncbi:VOC family protein [Actinoplanes sp. L3-i22]|uniref:VOC family protein n=1 Tax=Actinoplanes sp. L3-i22 TaxID=2836373 RepID=UPI001C776C98|nr:VOC family protein [Actinoplanes sp. L3-i22]BCY09354.1 glyoxalase [Actinoplanes sp. L3-i22]
MSSVINHITVDCVGDPYDLAQFWSAVTGNPLSDDDYPGDPEASVIPPAGAGPVMLFVRVPDAKTVKNRMHVDIKPADRTRDEEVTRLLDAGARLVSDRRRPDGTGWVVLGDPEGNEFCVERSDAERLGRRSEDAGI